MSKKSKKNEDNAMPFEQIRKLFNTSLPDYALETIYINTIKATMQSPYLENYYHCIVDFKDMKFLFLDGVKKILGYDDDTFTPTHNIDIIHPTYRSIVIEYTKKACKVLCNIENKPFIDKSHFCLQFPVLKKDTTYALMEMDVSSVVADEEGRPLAYYIRFKTLGQYGDTPVFIKPIVFFETDIDTSAAAQSAELEILNGVKDFLIADLGFTDAEKEALCSLAEINRKVKYIVEGDETTHENINHSKEILEKAQKNISPLFKDALSVAQYLQKIGII